MVYKAKHSLCGAEYFEVSVNRNGTSGNPTHDR